MNPTHHTVLITGGATGIGFAIAEKFHAAGNRVILVGRSEASLAKAAGLLAGVEICVADVCKAEDRARLVGLYPTVSVLVNNAGMQVMKPISDSTPDEIERELTTNFLAPVLLSQAFLPVLTKQPTAAIINVTSGLAIMPKKQAAIYCASKSALRSFSRTFAWQLADTSVRVFDVVPPLVETPMTAGRGKNKMSANDFGAEFWNGFKTDRYEMLIGQNKKLSLINRISPALAAAVVRRAQ